MPRPGPPIDAYRGNDPFVFVSYSHQDEARVYPELIWMRDQGFNVWFDEGISPGHRWTDELAQAIERSSLFLFFVTPNSVGSENCLNEIQFALSRQVTFLAVYLEPTELPPGLELSIANRQAILRYQHDKRSFHERLRAGLLHGVEQSSDQVRSAVSHTQAYEHSVYKSRSRRSWYVGAGLSVVAVVCVVALLWLLYKPVEEAQRSLAVLPFKDFTNAQRGYLADGLAEALIGQLGGIPGLRVSSSASSFSFKQDLIQGTVDLPYIHERLNVRYVVEGSILPDDGGEFRVSARLIDAQDDAQVWSRQWKGTEATIMDIQSQIATLVAEALNSGDLDVANMRKLRAVDVNAYDPYLRGKNYLRGAHSQENVQAAKNSFAVAIEHDPTFAQAHAGLCEAHLIQYRLNRDSLPFVMAQKSCAEALELQPDLWEVNVSLGALYRESGDYERSLQALDLALRARPDEASVHIERAVTLDRSGQLVEAEAEFVRAIELDPSYWGGYMYLANFYYDHVQYAKALEVYESISDMVTDDLPIQHSIASVLTAMGDYEGALETYENVLARQGSPRRSTLSNLGINYYYMGCFADAAYWQRQALQIAPSDHRIAGRLAESCRFVQGQEDTAQPLWGHAIDLARADRNQSSWETQGLIAIYHAHRGELESAQLALEEMWSSNPEPSIAHFFAAIVVSKRSDLSADSRRERLDDSIAQALHNGFPTKLLDHDPDLRPLRQCPLTNQRALDRECLLDK